MARTAAALHQQGAALRGTSVRRVAARPAAAPRSRRHVACTAMMEASQVLAATQQGVAFAVCSIAEAFYSSQSLGDGRKGSPNLLLSGALSAGVGVGTLLLNAGGDQMLFGSLAALACSGILCSVNLSRAQVVEGRKDDWPGPKVWPATMLLISFFSANVFFQACRAILEV